MFDSRKRVHSPECGTIIDARGQRTAKSEFVSTTALTVFVDASNNPLNKTRLLMRRIPR
jgi:hypothetical protein